MNRNISDSQNFIRKSTLVQNLLHLSNVDINKDDIIIEIGPGKGIISKELVNVLSNEGNLVLIELDKEYFTLLEDRYEGLSNVEVINININNYNFPKESFIVFSNIPFNYTSDILSKLLVPNSSLECAYLILQREALERWGGNQVYDTVGESLKSLLMYPFYEFSSIYNFERNDFTPAPSVDCVLAKIKKRENMLIKREDIETYNDFIASVSQVRVGEGIWTELFSRKQLHVLYKKYGLVKGRGIYYQNSESLLSSFNSLMTYVDEYKRRVIHGAMKRLEKVNEKLEKEYRTK